MREPSVKFVQGKKISSYFFPWKSGCALLIKTLILRFSRAMWGFSWSSLITTFSYHLDFVIWRLKLKVKQLHKKPRNCHLGSSFSSSGNKYPCLKKMLMCLQLPLSNWSFCVFFGFICAKGWCLAIDCVVSSRLKTGKNLGWWQHDNFNDDSNGCPIKDTGHYWQLSKTRLLTWWSQHMH